MMSEQMHLLAWGADPRWVKAALPGVLRALCPLPWHFDSSFDPGGRGHHSQQARGVRGAWGGRECPEAAAFPGPAPGPQPGALCSDSAATFTSLEGPAAHSKDAHFVISGVAPSVQRGGGPGGRGSTWALQVRSRGGTWGSCRWWPGGRADWGRLPGAPRCVCVGGACQACVGGSRLPPAREWTWAAIWSQPCAPKPCEPWGCRGPLPLGGSLPHSPHRGPSPPRALLQATTNWSARFRGPSFVPYSEALMWLRAGGPCLELEQSTQPATLIHEKFFLEKTRPSAVLKMAGDARDGQRGRERGRSHARTPVRLGLEGWAWGHCGRGEWRQDPSSGASGQRVLVAGSGGAPPSPSLLWVSVPTSGNGSIPLSLIAVPGEMLG